MTLEWFGEADTQIVGWDTAIGRLRTRRRAAVLLVHRAQRTDFKDDVDYALCLACARAGSVMRCTFGSCPTPPTASVTHRRNRRSRAVSVPLFDADAETCHRKLEDDRCHRKARSVGGLLWRCTRKCSSRQR